MAEGRFSYSGDPSASSLDEVRFLIQDTDRDDFEISDDEIAYLIAKWGDAQAAAIASANILVARFAALEDKSVGDLSISFSQRADHYRDLAQHLSSSAGGSSTRPKPILMGRTTSQKDAAIDDTDRIGTSFERGQDDFATNQDVNPLEKNWV